MINNLLIAAAHKERTALAYAITGVTGVEQRELLCWTRERLQGKTTLLPNLKVPTAVLLQMERWLTEVQYSPLAVRTALVLLMSNT